jgi:hypothetical protein
MYTIKRCKKVKQLKCRQFFAVELYKGYAVAQLVEELLYKLEGRGFDSRWCHWNFSLT